MTTPQDIQAAVEAIKQSMPGVPRDFAPQRAAGMKMLTVEEGFRWLENVANAVTGSSRLPLTTVTTREADGSLTIRVIPTGDS